MKRFLGLAILLLASASANFVAAVNEPRQAASAPTPPGEGPQEGSAAARAEHVTLRGKAVWTAEALKRRFDIESDEDAEHSSVSMETADGQLFTIVKDFRGRGFFKDPRLLGIDLELYAKRLGGSNMIQIIRVYTLHDGKKFELDYWCDICSIPMYELKPCECCQGETRLREREVAENPKSK